ncbi:MAG: hypothetical protein CL674_01435 [Bdellovibrionaceae bacterium]|nr:hypothetical protein [Pseudobdellovibrionaceae bacterium]|tara:strand:+ start:3677 stop:4381 length:705 start_codon:yes stop_codon:yes gene_type:complete
MMKIYAILSVLFFAQIAQALPSNDLWIPSATVMQKNYLRIDVQQEYTFEKNASGNNHWSSLGATLGVFENAQWSMEAGADYMEPVGEKFSDSLQLNVKGVYAPSENSRWKSAFGLRNFALGSDGNFQILYGLAEVFTRKNESTRVGLYFGSSKRLVDSDGEKSNSGLMFGYYRQLTDDTGRLAIEWISGNNAFAYLLLGAHLRFAENVNCVIGYGFPNESDYKQRIITRVSLFY